MPIIFVRGRSQSTSPLFSQTLYYNESYGGSVKQYNGNISAMSWKTLNEGTTLLGYAFSYDNLSRLTKATYLGNGSVYVNGYETSYTYDKMGNMKTLARNGLKAVSTYGPVDNLTMSYAGNQLIKVEDALANISVVGSMDFKNYSNVATEYTYNKNGAMTKDLNKGISDIQYNNLNLPRQMDIKSPVAEARNEYTYTTTGAKLKVVKKWNPNYSTTPVVGSTINPALLTLNETTDYVANKVYENGVLKRILIDNGYIEGNIYYFYIKDHLGNNRITAKSDGTLVQATHYYPFGTSFAVGIGSTVQPYKYGGKELDVMHGLNQYDFAARQKDDWRFTTVDPHSEKYYSWSPYVYGFNNPMRFTDPTGKDGWDILSGIGDAIYNNYSWGATDAVGLNKESYQVNSSSDYNIGRSVGDAASVVAGVLEVVVGGVAAGGGTVTSPTGVGVGVAVAGGAAVGHGVGVIGKALQGNGKMEMNDNGKSKGNSSSSETSQTEITRSSKGGDGGTSKHIIETDSKGNTVSKTHQVTRDGEVVHQHQDFVNQNRPVGETAKTRQFPDEWVKYPNIDKK